ncbi:MAG: hypothetical protein ABL872_04050 [Lacibacter sp.]
MDNPNPNNDLVISYLQTRKAIGWLGMLLPFLLLIGNLIINKLNILNNSFFVLTKGLPAYVNQGSYKFSVSHYYYSTVGELFTSVLCAVALFMFSYKGHPLCAGEKGLSDKATTTLAGFFALGIVIFPTGSNIGFKDNLRTFVSTMNVGYIHFGMATLFFLSLAIMSMVNFRRTEDRISFGKKENHRLFLICGIIMILCLVLITVYSILLQGMFKWLDAIHPVFIFEAIALIAFGISWLVKGQTDFKYIPRKLNLVK